MFGYMDPRGCGTEEARTLSVESTDLVSPNWAAFRRHLCACQIQKSKGTVFARCMKDSCTCCCHLLFIFLVLSRDFAQIDLIQYDPLFPIQNQ